MEGLNKAFDNFTKDSKLAYSRFNSEKSPLSEGLSAALSSSSDNSRVLVAARPPRQVVSLLTCSKLCAVCFTVGVVVGYTLKRRVKRWASRLLKRLKDD